MLPDTPGATPTKPLPTGGAELEVAELGVGLGLGLELGLELGLWLGLGPGDVGVTLFDGEPLIVGLGRWPACELVFP